MTGQQSGTGGLTNLDDEKVRKDDILSNRDKATRAPGQSLDGTGVQVDEYKDIPTNQRPEKDATDDTADDQDPIDRPGFDQGGANRDNSAGKGLGLGEDAKGGRKDWKLPR